MFDQYIETPKSAGDSWRERYIVWAGVVPAIVAASVTPVLFDMRRELGLGDLVALTPCIVLGIGWAVYLGIFLRVPSPLRGLGFLLAVPLAPVVGVAAMLFSTPNVLGSIPFFSYFLGGAAAGFVVAFAALLYYSEQEGLTQVFVKAIGVSVGGGLLAWPSAIVAQSMQNVLAGPPQGGDDALLFVVLIWGGGMGAMMGWMFLRDTHVAPFDESSPVPAADPPPVIQFMRLACAGVQSVLLLLVAAFLAR